VPFTTGLAAAIAVLAVAGSAPAFGAGVSTSAAADAVRAQEWWLAGLNVPQTWPQTRGAGVTVAVLGTGVAAGHPDLAGDVLTGPDYTDSGRRAGGPYWGIDGTQVAAIIAGHGHGPARQSGVVGVAPAAKILSIRVTLEFNDPLNADQAITRRLPGAIADGITYAVNHGARVIDLPLDPGTFGLTGDADPAAAGGSHAEQVAVSYALRKSVVLVAPAGDDGAGPGLVNYPAAYTGVIAVGAVSRGGRLAPFSSKRSYVSLTAPGVDLTAATTPAGYATVSSTSAASGIVAGVAALLLSRYPQLTVAQVTQALTMSTGATSVTDGAAGPGTGYGTLDAARAVTLAADISAATGSARLAASPSAISPSATSPAPPAPSPARRVQAAPQGSASAFAGSLLRDIVAALGALIVLVVVLLLIMSSRRKRALAGPGPRSRNARGQHGQHRPDQETARPARPQPDPAVPAAPASVWPAPGGWQGGSIGEIARPPAAPHRPATAPAPRTTPRPRSDRGAGPAARPPWAPAPEPERTFGLLPVAPPGSFTPTPGSSIRVPPDMAAIPATMTGPGPAAFDPAGFHPAGHPAAPDRATRPPVVNFPAAPPAFPPPPPVFPPPAQASPPPGPASPPSAQASPPSGADLDTGPEAADLDVTRPIPGADPLSKRSLGFAAAPVATGFPVRDISARYRRVDAPALDGQGPEVNSSFIWDLTATDVFPVASSEPPPGPDDAPGASGS
jgi:subtilisin family serine protease